MYPSILCGIIHYKWVRTIPLWVASSNQDRLRPIYRTPQANNYSKQAKSSPLLGHATFTGSVFNLKLESAQTASRMFFHFAHLWRCRNGVFVGMVQAECLPCLRS